MNIEDVPAALRAALSGDPDRWSLTERESYQFRALIEKVLARNEWTYYHLAELAKVERKSVYRFMGGKCATLATLRPIAEALGLEEELKQIMSATGRTVFEATDVFGTEYRIYRTDGDGVI